MTLIPTVSSPSTGDTPALAALVAALQDKHGAAVNGVLIYGSCLRSGDVFDGLLDLYLICDSYQGVYPGRLLAAANWLLPPNVFYTEVEYAGRVLRTKYAVLTSSDLQRGTSRRSFESYLWGRFAQPVAIAWCRDHSSRASIEANLLQAVTTFLHSVLPALPATGPVELLWRQGLSLSYATELRSERSNRTTELTAAGLDHFAAVTRLAEGCLAIPFSLHQHQGQLHYRSHVPLWQRRTSGLRWLLRRVLGKLKSILRLLKALYTFAGGLDYIAWKLQRHSGQEIVIPARVRRAPLLFIWGFCWRLYRQGVFR